MARAKSNKTKVVQQTNSNPSSKFDQEDEVSYHSESVSAWLTELTGLTNIIEAPRDLLLSEAQTRIANREWSLPVLGFWHTGELLPAQDRWQYPRAHRGQSRTWTETDKSVMGMTTFIPIELPYELVFVTNSVRQVNVFLGILTRAFFLKPSLKIMHKQCNVQFTAQFELSGFTKTQNLKWDETTYKILTANCLLKTYLLNDRLVKTINLKMIESKEGLDSDAASLMDTIVQPDGTTQDN